MRGAAIQKTLQRRLGFVEYAAPSPVKSAYRKLAHHHLTLIPPRHTVSAFPCSRINIAALRGGFDPHWRAL
jgi:hypothetical protein